MRRYFAAVMRQILLQFSLSLCAGCLLAQDAPYIRNFTPADYGCRNQNWSLAQSPETGWVYAGNNGGMLECDGARWQVYSLPENQTVRAVATGMRGEVFCGGFAEFGYWKTGPDGQLHYHSLSAGVHSDRLGKEEIWHIVVRKDFVLFQSFSTVYKYDYQQVAILKPPNSIMFAHDIYGRILVPVIGRGIYELLPDNTFQFLPGTEALSDKIVQFMVPGGKGGIWAGTTNYGIFQIAQGKCLPLNHPLNSTFKQYQLNKAVALKQGGWVIGTILNGAYILDSLGQLRFHLNRENGLQNNTVLALNEDREGNLWIGLDRGIDLVNLRSPLTFFTDQTGKIGTLYSAARWNGQFYVGTNQGVFVRNSGGFSLVEGTQGQVWELKVFDKQLLCGHNAGTFELSGTYARKISDTTGGWCTIRVPDRNGILLQSTYTGLIVFHRSASGNWILSNRVKGFTEPLKKIVFDASGNLWGVHPNKGLYRIQLDAALSQVINYRLFTKADGLPTDFQLDILRLDKDLVVNANAVPLLVEDLNRHVKFSAVTGIQQKQKWLPGFKGDYFAVDSSGVQLHTGAKTYTLRLSLVPNFENIVALSPEEYLFCLENGFALLNKKNLDLIPVENKPRCQLRRLEITGGQSFIPGPGLSVPFKNNSIHFYFASAGFERTPNFSWKLDGYAAAWSGWQTNPEKEFTNLPSGKYVFHVRSDTGGAEASYSFQIEKPWYLSAWAVLCYGFVFIALIGFGEKTSRNRLDRQRLQLEEDKRLELTRQRNKAEREKLALEVENKNRELSNAALNLIRKNEVLQRLRDDLLLAKGDPRSLQQLARLIDRHLEGDHDWELFEESFNRVHDQFFKRLMQEFSDLTPGDMRLAAYLKMNLSSKEIAPLLNISVRGVENKRYRLRKKLNLPEDANLTEFIMAY